MLRNQLNQRRKSRPYVLQCYLALKSALAVRRFFSSRKYAKYTADSLTNYISQCKKQEKHFCKLSTFVYIIDRTQQWTRIFSKSRDSFEVYPSCNFHVNIQQKLCSLSGAPKFRSFFIIFNQLFEPFSHPFPSKKHCRGPQFA